MFDIPSNVTLSSQGQRVTFERVVKTYLVNHSNVDFHWGMVYLLSPLVCCIGEEADVYFAYCTLLDVIGTLLIGFVSPQ